MSRIAGFLALLFLVSSLFLVSLSARALSAVSGAGIFDASHPNAGPFDWLTGQENCRLVQVSDIGTTGTASYQWDWGDNTTEKTNQSVVRHVYQPGTYRLHVTAFSSSGTVKNVYYLDIVTLGNDCSLKLFAKYVTFPAFIGTIGYGISGGLLMMSPKTARNKLGRKIIMISIALMVVFIVAAGYAGILFPGL